MESRQVATHHAAQTTLRGQYGKASAKCVTPIPPSSDETAKGLQSSGKLETRLPGATTAVSAARTLAPWTSEG